MEQRKKKPAGVTGRLGDGKEGLAFSHSDSESQHVRATQIQHGGNQPTMPDNPTGGNHTTMSDAESIAQDLVPAMPPAHLLPILDNTVKTLFYWAMDLDIPTGRRMVLLNIIRHVEWSDGTGCTASIPTLARESHQTKRQR